MNKIEITGRLTQDVKLTNGCAQTSIAVKRPTKNDEADFFNIVAFKQNAEFLSAYAHKGDLVAITGALRTRKGEHTTFYDIVADSVEILSHKETEQEQEKPRATTIRKEDVIVNLPELNNPDDDLPF